MSYCLYRSPTIGDGLTPRTAFRAKLQAYVVNDGTMDFDSWTDRRAAFQYCLTSAPDKVHDQIDADGEIKALSPRFADAAELDAWLAGTVGTIDAETKTALEGDGVTVRDADTRQSMLAQKALRSITIMGASLVGTADGRRI